MRIENLTAKSLTEMKKPDLHILRLRFTQLWNANFKGNLKKNAGALGRKDLVRRYKLLVKEMNDRGLTNVTVSALDQYIFDRSIFKFSVTELGDLIVIPDFCSISGSFVRNPEEAEDIDVVLRTAEESKSEKLEEELGRVLQKHLNKDLKFVYNTEDPHSSFIPLYDLVLQPKDATQVTRIRETEVRKKEYAEQIKEIEKNATDEISKPYPNEHSARLQDPDKYDKWSRTEGGKIYLKIVVPKTISIIWGHPKGTPEHRWIPQALRFPIDSWTVATAKKWLKDNNVKFISFEEAKKETKKKDSIDVRKKLTEAQRKECDEETERIRRNAKTEKARLPHPFSPAQFTHKNGHPRCLICGDEELIGGICEGVGKEKIGKLGFKVGDKGSAVLQLHILGLSEVEAAAFKTMEKRIMIARGDLSKLQKVLGIAGREKEAHVDILMSKEAHKSWQGGELVIEDVSGLSKLKKLHTQGKLCFAWKKEGGSLSSMLLGESSVHVSKSEKAGDSESQLEAMIQLDKSNWEIYVADEQIKKIRFESRYLKGNYLFDADDKGIWRISRLKEADYDETIKKRLPESVPIFKVNEDEQIVGGIVYEPKKEDAQGDFSTEDEIRQACYYFMEHTRKFKLQHEGSPITQKINILENYIAPKEFEIGKEKIQKGSWILIIRIRDAALWKLVKEGTITGFSMAGLAHRRRRKEI